MQPVLNLNFEPFPELITEHLLLRDLRMDDKQEVFALRSDKEHMQYIAKPLAKTIKDAEEHIRAVHIGIASRELINWAITFKGNNKLIGMIGFYRMTKEHYRGEVGYMLHKEHHRKGIMHEALTAVVDYGFQKIKFHQVEAIIDKENIASEKLLLKNLFVKDAHFKENYFFDGKFLDSVHYARISKEK